MVCFSIVIRSFHKLTKIATQAERLTGRSRALDLDQPLEKLAEHCIAEFEQVWATPVCHASRGIGNRPSGARLQSHLRTCVATHPQKLLQLIPAALVIQQSATPKDVKGRHQGNVS
jgi:hypothetical protein